MTHCCRVTGPQLNAKLGKHSLTPEGTSSGTKIHTWTSLSHFMIKFPLLYFQLNDKKARHKTSIKKFRFKLLMFDLRLRCRRSYCLRKDGKGAVEGRTFFYPFIVIKNLAENFFTQFIKRKWIEELGWERRKAFLRSFQCPEFQKYLHSWSKRYWKIFYFWWERWTH